MYLELEISESPIRSVSVSGHLLFFSGEEPVLGRWGPEEIGSLWRELCCAQPRHRPLNMSLTPEFGVDGRKIIYDKDGKPYVSFVAFL